MKKRTVCLILVLTFIFALFPSMAFAADRDAGNGYSIVHNPDKQNEGNNLVTNKTLDYDNKNYSLNLETYARGAKVSKSIPLDITLVIDQSASMASKDMNAVPTLAGNSWTIENATGSTQYYYKVGDKYYPVQALEGPIYQKVDNKPDVYQMFGKGHCEYVIEDLDAHAKLHLNVPTNYYCIGTDGKAHKIWFVTAGAFGFYYAYPYYYYDENDIYVPADSDGYEKGYSGSLGEKWSLVNNGPEWRCSVGYGGLWGAKQFLKLTNRSKVNTYGSGYCDKASIYNGPEGYIKWCSDGKIGLVGKTGAKNATIANHNDVVKSFTFFTNGDPIDGDIYLPKDGTTFNRLCYVDDNGNKVEIPNTTTYVENETINNLPLYKYEGTETRTQVLQRAVTNFVDLVKENAAENNVDHRMAIVGFAGNKTPALYNGGTYIGENGPYDYTNTGIFVNGEFINYEKIVGYRQLTADDTAYINYHYYIIKGGKYVPVLYRNGAWYPLGENTPVTKATSNSPSNNRYVFYEAEYDSLDSNNHYKKALVSVNDNGTVNADITDAINQFANYGGTYTSYGMTMANQVLENNYDEDRNHIIVVFTDGEPGGNGFDASIAGEALADANIAKNTYDTKIYTVGLYPGDGKASADAQEFLTYLSSEKTREINNVTPSSKGINSELKNTDEKKNPDYTYYYTDSEGKTFAVKAKRQGISSLGWWNNDGTAYRLVQPRDSSDDNRSYVTRFYEGSNEVFSDTVEQNLTKTYYTSSTIQNETTAIKYEYRWYNSNNEIVEPKTTMSDGVQFFELGATHDKDASDDTSYCLYADNEESLVSAFESISETMSGTNLDGDNSQVVDVISNEFDVPMSEGAVAAGVSVSTAKAIDFDNEGNPTEWGSSIPVDPSIISYTWGADGKTLTVNGFDFSANYVSKDREGTDKGSKLIITISGLKPNTVGDHVYSNTTASGVYKQDDEGNWEEDPTLEFPRPYLDTTDEVFHVQVATYKDGALNEQSKWIKKDYHFTTDEYYKNGEVQPYNKLTLLEKEGNDYKYLYGGLYEDEAFKKPVKAADMRGLTFIPKIGKTYYIKQVDPSYLKVKTIYTSWGDDVVSMYPVTVVDSKNYSEAGLIRNVKKDGESIKTPLANTDSYDMIRLNYKDGSKIYTSDGRSVTIDGTTYDNPTNLFGVPGYMVVKNETQNGYTGSYQPYWITLDGVKVTGQMVRTLNNTSKVSEMRSGVSDVNKLKNIDISEDTTYTEETAKPLKVKSMFVSADEEETPVDTGIKLSGYTTSLNGNIAMNFYMDLSDEVASDKDAYMQFTLPGANHTEEVVKLADARKQVRGGKTYYVFSAGVAAKDMTSVIKAQFVKGDGTKSEVWSYTIKEYCDYIRSHPESYDKESVALVENMLNYGGYTQEYFKHNTDKLANADLDLALPEANLDETFDPVVSGECTGLTYQGTSSMLTTTTGLKHYFDIKGDADDYTFKANGKELQLHSDKNGFYVHVDNIKAKDLNKPIAVTVTHKDGSTYTLKYSVYTNVKQVLESDSFTTAAKNMMKALYGYGEAAIAYFATRN